MTPPTRPLYLDCDTEIDDALAIAVLLGSPALELVGLGTVCGNTTVDQAAENSARLLSLVGELRTPVARGEARPLEGEFDGGWPHVHGINGIGGVVLPPSSRPLSEESAPAMIVRLAEEHQGSLEILAIGPLTNLARALDLDTQLPSKVRRLTIMGGAVWVPGNVTEFAEANIHVDPEAASAVLAAGWEVTLVPLDVTMQHWFDTSHQAVMAASGKPAARALASMLNCYLDFHEASYGVRRVALHDPLAAVIAAADWPVEPALLTGLRVTVSADERGRTLPDVDSREVRVVMSAPEDVHSLILRRSLDGVSLRRDTASRPVCDAEQD